MKTVLILNSSPTPEDSVSTQLTSFFKQELLARGEYKVIARELGIQPPSHLCASTLSGFFIDAHKHNEAQKKALEESTLLVNELKSSDIIIIGAAMHNHTVTSGLKAYIDQVTRPGLTFKYGDEGPQGLLTNKKVFVIISAGGDYSSGDAIKSDLVTPLLKIVLGFIGLNDITFIPAFNTYASNNIVEESQRSAREAIKTEAINL